jgi:hypothetical protein
MFGSIRRSIRLIGESYRVLRQDPELILLTLASFFGISILTVALGGFGLITGAFSLENETISGLGFALMAMGYFGGYFTIIYFQVALVAAVMHRMDGYDPDIRYALNRANHRLGAIVMWASIAATVGLLLRALESAARGKNGEQPNMLAQIVIGLLGFSWSMIVFFVIPVIVVEQTSGLNAIKRSSSILKDKFGETVVGNQGIGLIVFLATALFAGIPLLLGTMVWNSTPALGIVFLISGLGIGVFLAAGGASLDSTYRAVLYRYATAGEGGQFSREVLDSAFRPKNDLRRFG